MVNKKIVALAAVLMVIVVAVAAVASMSLFHPSTNSNQPLKVIRQDSLGGIYNAVFNVTGTDKRGFDNGDLIYTTDGIEHIGYYNAYMNASLAWIKSNTPENVVFMNWWDYGHAIVALGERGSINKNPSQEALKSVIGPVSELDPNSKITDVANALTTTEENTTKSIMQSYGASYLYITFDDARSKAYWIFDFAGLNATKYMSTFSLTFPQSERLDYTTLGTQTMIYRLYNNYNLTLFTQVYSDENVVIYKLTS